ncbi:MAG TPA: DUF1223 domain-containing protein [Caulobacteraceae bacterium]|nr:DUF1223 domain-containing protein [Caulobacteraceae bacterium]
MIPSSNGPRRFGGLISAMAGLAALSAASAPTVATAADAAHPTVVELFQSQGCSDCPPANANVLTLADRPDVLTLSWQVTYWDQLGWKDTFGQPAFTSRQWDYARGLGHSDVATPEVVVNGRADVVGNRRDEIVDLIRREDRGDSGPRVTITGDHVTIAGAGAHAVVVLVRYDPNIIQVPIRRGENGGLTLPHKNVVREVVKLGDWNGGSRTYALPAAGRPGLKTAVLVQAGQGGPILAAGRA